MEIFFCIQFNYYNNWFYKVKSFVFSFFSFLRENLSNHFTKKTLLERKKKVKSLQVSHGTNPPTSRDLDLEAFNGAFECHLKYEPTVPSNKLSLISILTEEEWKISGDMIKSVSLSLENWNIFNWRK